MKSITIITSIGILLYFSANLLNAQSVSFAYDNAGNRISRTIEEQGGGLKGLYKSDSIETGEESIEEEPIGEEFLDGQTRIFPNPTQGLITIHFHPDSEESYHISVNSQTGHQLINQRIFEGKNNLDISKYPPGTYVITIYGKEESSKWIILKI